MGLAELATNQYVRAVARVIFKPFPDLKRKLANYLGHANELQIPNELKLPNKLQLRVNELQLRVNELQLRVNELQLRANELGLDLGLEKARTIEQRYQATRSHWQVRALSHELFGPPNPTHSPPAQMPEHLKMRFLMDEKARFENGWGDATRPDNWPIIYTDEEIDSYIAAVKRRDFFIYGAVDGWVIEAMQKYPIAGKDAVTMGSMTPWYESMILCNGGRANTIEYNRIICRTNRIKAWTPAEWEATRQQFDYALSISSFEHDGLGAYGDPIDPDGDLNAMRKMKEVVKPGGILLFAVPVGVDTVRWNTCRIYGRVRLPMMLEGWDWIDSFGYHEQLLDSEGHVQPVLVLRNAK